MKKDELTHIIREIVAEEIRRELPNAIAEVFANVMGQKQSITEHVAPTPRKVMRRQVIDEPEESLLKRSLKEMFDGTPVMRPQTKPQSSRQFAKDPKINDILNQTRPFTPQERTGASLGMAAMMAAANSNPMPMASPTMPMGEENEPSYLRNVPSMVPMNQTPSQMPSISQAELLREDHVPLSDLPEGISVHDVKQYAPPAVAEALTRDYSQFMKLVDRKKGKV